MNSNTEPEPGVTVFEFVFGEEVFLENLARQRSLSKWRWLSIVTKLAVGIGLVLLIYRAIRDGFSPAILLFGGLLVLLLASGKIDRWHSVRGLKRSPYYNEQLSLRLLEERIEITGSIADVSERWDAITRAVHFPDGLLLYQGPGIAKWLPFSTLASGSEESAVRLVKSKVARFETK